jgi:flagellar L-ring protein precursor FlgH
MKNYILPVLAMTLLTACGPQFDQLAGAPELSPAGSGLTDPNLESIAQVYPVSQESQSTWIGGSADFFRDRRAHNVGDILTVEISINDKAALSNNSNVERKSSADADLGLTYDIMGVVKADTNAEGDINSNTKSSGQGSTARSEKIELSVAAVVTAVLPNGYLVIKGTQEIRVNYEGRLLSISGIVQPRNISDDGTVAYDKIAEARISYGGKGTITDVQKPGWGHRIWNKLTPF